MSTSQTTSTPTSSAARPHLRDQRIIEPAKKKVAKIEETHRGPVNGAGSHVRGAGGDRPAYVSGKGRQSHLLLLNKHVDLGAVLWPEAYLSTYNHILVIASRSQDFENEVNQMKAYNEHQKQITTYIKNFRGRFIASAWTYTNLVQQVKSKQKTIDKMEAAGLI